MRRRDGGDNFEDKNYPRKKRLCSASLLTVGVSFLRLAVIREDNNSSKRFDCSDRADTKGGGDSFMDL